MSRIATQIHRKTLLHLDLGGRTPSLGELAKTVKL